MVVVISWWTLNGCCHFLVHSIWMLFLVDFGWMLDAIHRNASDMRCILHVLINTYIKRVTNLQMFNCTPFLRTVAEFYDVKQCNEFKLLCLFFFLHLVVL